jgi:type I restriction enzyme R subunit
MPPKEAKARIKINKLLEEAGWRLIDGREGKADVVFESKLSNIHRSIMKCITKIKNLHL